MANILQNADIGVADRPVVVQRDPGLCCKCEDGVARARRAHEHGSCLAPAGMIDSSKMNLRKSAIGCSTSHGPTNFGSAPDMDSSSRSCVIAVDQHRSGNTSTTTSRQQAFEHIAHEGADRRLVHPIDEGVRVAAGGRAQMIAMTKTRTAIVATLTMIIRL